MTTATITAEQDYAQGWSMPDDFEWDAQDMIRVTPIPTRAPGHNDASRVRCVEPCKTCLRREARNMASIRAGVIADAMGAERGRRGWFTHYDAAMVGAVRDAERELGI